MAIEQPITGAVLEWALATAKYSHLQLDYDLQFAPGSTLSWINGAKPNQGQLRKLAKALNRPPSFFFLPNPPTVTSVVAEFRKFAGTDVVPGPETLEAMRLAGRIQKTTAWVRDQTKETPIAIPIAKKSENVEEVAERLRRWLNWSTAWQLSADQSDSSVTKQFRVQLESNGVLVMHQSLDEGVTRGFSLASGTAPLIAINTRDPYRARLFSYAHELVHLASGSTAVCDVHDVSDNTETFCNRVAAAILMPRIEFGDHVRSKLGGRKVSSLEDVALVRTRFRVSLRAAAIRAETLGLASIGLYDLVNRRAEVKKRGGQFIPGNERVKPVIRVDEFGTSFIRTVESGVSAGILKSLQAANLLRLSEKEWTLARQLALSGPEAR
ncbi:ImmA/IrrE family metallo-endopeptidase [Cryobacterium sp. TMT2-4]|uniref:ImmA/IrrE family metallo-endopeptidase n=1 Tax=Cryobacterium sp. TMT2-4 TaxID=1259254 RepID=UPI00106B3F2A|nr:ImmA/IrrE family metallo-endopeptidase [Cryobacterium sp. TMT2-4]TFC71612.1 ImmA/IrrE family metallo-endopeptidase [Cryobacterium sp. TMT2-4]